MSSELLFSYGTLQQKNVQLTNFGRVLEGNPDTLVGYEIGEIEIFDERVIQESGKKTHPILKHTGKETDEVEGTVYQISLEELCKADDYEVKEYKRTSARLKSGLTCWIYAAEIENA